MRLFIGSIFIFSVSYLMPLVFLDSAHAATWASPAESRQVKKNIDPNVRKEALKVCLKTTNRGKKRGRVIIAGLKHHCHDLFNASALKARRVLVQNSSSRNETPLPGGASISVKMTDRSDTKIENVQLWAECLNPEIFQKWLKDSVEISKSNLFQRDRGWFVLQLWHRQDVDPYSNANTGAFENVSTLASKSFNLSLNPEEVFAKKSVKTWLAELKGQNPNASLDSNICSYLGTGGKRLRSFDARSVLNSDSLGNLALSFAIIKDTEPGRIFTFAKLFTGLLGTIKANFKIANLGEINFEHTNEKIDLVQTTFKELGDFKDKAGLKNVDLEFNKNVDEYTFRYKGTRFLKLWTERKESLFPKFIFSDNHQVRAQGIIKDTAIKAKLKPIDSSLETKLNAFVLANGSADKDSISSQIKGAGVAKKIKTTCASLDTVVAALNDYTPIDRAMVKLAFALSNAGSDVVENVDSRWQVTICLGRSDANLLQKKGHWFQSYEDAIQQSEDTLKPPSIQELYERYRQFPNDVLAKIMFEHSDLINPKQKKAIDKFTAEDSAKLWISRDTASVSNVCYPLRIIATQMFDVNDAAILNRALFVSAIANATPDEKTLPKWKLAACLTERLSKSIVEGTDLHNSLLDALSRKRAEELDSSNSVGVFTSQSVHMERFRRGLSATLNNPTRRNVDRVLKRSFGGTNKPALLPGDNLKETAKSLDEVRLYSFMDTLSKLKGNDNNIGMGCYHRIQPECGNEIVNFKIGGKKENTLLFGAAELGRNEDGLLTIDYLEFREATNADCFSLKGIFEGDRSACDRSEPWKSDHCQKLLEFKQPETSRLCSGAR